VGNVVVLTILIRVGAKEGVGSRGGVGWGSDYTTSRTASATLAREENRREESREEEG
jgi:hypothetical protein